MLSKGTPKHPSNPAALTGTPRPGRGAARAGSRSPSDGSPRGVRREEVPQFPVRPPDTEANVRLRHRRPRGRETDGEPGVPEVARELLQRRRGGLLWRNGPDGPHLEHRLREGGHLGHGAQHGLEGRAELRLREGAYLSGEAPPGGFGILGLRDGDPRALRSGPSWQRGQRWHLLGAPPREHGLEPGGPGDVGGDQAGRLAGQERDGPPRASPRIRDEARSVAARPQRAARSSVWDTSRAASESSSLRGPAAAPTKPWKSGCGLRGRLLNSGWNWLPIKNGWSLSSAISTSRPSGEVPEKTMPASCRASL